MDRGYLALWRRYQDHPFWKEKREFSKAEAWIDILWEAQHKEEPQVVMVGMSALKCNYGESLKSLRTWARRWGWGSDAKVRRFLILCQDLGQIRFKSEGKTTRITVLNYDQYDPKRRNNDATTTHDRSSTDARPHTDKNDKHEKNVKNKTLSLYDFYISEIHPFRKSKQRALKNIKSKLNKISYDDLRAAILNYKSTLNGSDPKFRKDPANFFGITEPYCEDFVPDNFKNEHDEHLPKQESVEDLVN